jgi:hypothetical protein
MRTIDGDSSHRHRWRLLGAHKLHAGADPKGSLRFKREMRVVKVCTVSGCKEIRVSIKTEHAYAHGQTPKDTDEQAVALGAFTARIKGQSAIGAWRRANKLRGEGGRSIPIDPAKAKFLSPTEFQRVNEGCSERGENCRMCSGEACNKCGAGCWNSAATIPCEHDVTERHEKRPPDEYSKHIQPILDVTDKILGQTDKFMSERMTMAMVGYVETDDGDENP